MLGLLSAVFFDLKTRKVPNQLILVFFAVAIFLSLLADGLQNIGGILASLGTAIIFVLPLYLLRAIGGGDVKLLIVFSILCSWNGVITTVFAALFWGSVLGVLQSIISGQGKVLAQNLVALALRTKQSEKVLHKIPFTVAILFGWLTHLSLINVGYKWI